VVGAAGSAQGLAVNRGNIVFILVMALLVLQLVQHYFLSGT
jgi:hypothetical protein